MTGPPPAPPSGSRFARSVWLVLRKDLTVEVRSGEIAYTTLFFAVSCVLIFAFALVKEGRAPEGGAAGILWIAILFSSTLALGRGFERERAFEQRLRRGVVVIFELREQHHELAFDHGVARVAVLGLRLAEAIGAESLCRIGAGEIVLPANQVRSRVRAPNRKQHGEGQR